MYSTGVGRICAKCGWPADDCRCSSTIAEQPVPQKVTAKLRLETKGRGGKAVTVLYDLPHNSTFLRELSQELKRVCGTGGAVTDAGVELQGDLRERVRAILLKKGWSVKG